MTTAHAFNHPSVPHTLDDLATLKANLSLRSEAPVPGNSRPAAISPERPRPGRAQDILTAFSEVAGETDRVRRDARLLALAGRWIDASREDAVGFALGLALQHGADGDDSGGLLENLSAQWADREPAAALDWVREQPAGDRHDRLMARVAFILSKSDPHTAACQVAEEMEPGPAQTEAILSVLHQWTAVDPAAAAGWVRDFPPGSLRDRALHQLAGCLSYQQPAMSDD